MNRNIDPQTDNTDTEGHGGKVPAPDAAATHDTEGHGGKLHGPEATIDDTEGHLSNVRF